MAGGGGEAEDGHVAVDGLVLAGIDKVALVEEADAAVLVADDFVEAAPGGHMGLALGAGEALKVVKRAPILNQDDGATPNEGTGAKEALLGVGVQLAEHARHRQERGHPLAEREKLVDTHADEKDDERLVRLCRVAAGNRLGHAGAS